MKKIILPFLLFFALGLSHAQLKIDVNSVEKSIKEKDIKRQNQFTKLEIISANEKITVVNDSLFYTREIKNLDTNENFIFERKYLSNELVDVDLLKEDGFKLDKAPYKVITILNDNTKEEKEYQSNRQLDELFKRIRIKSNMEFEYFLDFLPSGNYTYNLFINQPIKVKSDFFIHLEKLMNDKDIYIKKGALNQPKIVLNQKQVSFAEVDLVNADQVKSITIYNNEKADALYGSSSKDGIVIIELK